MSPDEQKVHDVICDAFALAYGTDGEPSVEYWTVGAELAVSMLVDAGWLPPNADAHEGAQGECPHDYWRVHMDGTTSCRRCGADTTHMDGMGG